jgi:hypothetical protein
MAQERTAALKAMETEMEKLRAASRRGYMAGLSEGLLGSEGQQKKCSYDLIFMPVYLPGTHFW